MKKLTSFHKDHRVRETETPTTQFPVQTPTGSQPRGVHSRSQAAHLDAGPAEPRTKPAGDLRRGSYPIGRKEP